MSRLKYLGKVFNAKCELCDKSWIKQKDMYQLNFPHPALMSLELKKYSKQVCDKCAKREEKNLFNKIKKEL